MPKEYIAMKEAFNDASVIVNGTSGVYGGQMKDIAIAILAIELYKDYKISKKK